MSQEYQVFVKAGTRIVAEMAERVEGAVVVASLEAKPLVGGSSELTAIEVPFGPNEIDRKWELSAGKWYKINGVIRQIEDGKRWIAWWDHLSKIIELKDMGNMPASSANVPLWGPGTYKKGDLRSDSNGVIFYSLVDNNTWALGNSLKWKKGGNEVNVIDGFESDSDSEASSANNAKVLYQSKMNKSEKGIPNGVASLGPTGKIKTTEIDLSGLQYKGLWNADENIPVIINGNGADGDFYMVSIGGTQDLGNGEIDYIPFSYVIYSKGYWEQNTGTRSVAPADYEDYFGV